MCCRHASCKHVYPLSRHHINHSVTILSVCLFVVCLFFQHLCTQILLSCEAQFDHSFPSSILGSLYTMGDVLKHLESRPPSPEPTSLFPNIDKENLPPNLSIQTRTVPKKAQRRVPFQNYSRPESAEFPTKKQKDARARRGKVFR